MDFSIPMALVDFIPVIFFSIGSACIGSCLYYGMKKYEFAMYSAGAIFVGVSGASKAIWKLLYAANICDFERLNSMFFPMKTLGFLMIAYATCMLIIRKRKMTTLFAVAPIAPPIFEGTMMFVVILVLSVLGESVALSVISVRLKKPSALVLIIISAICTLAMGYLSTKDFSLASMNWIAEFVNIVGQGTFMVSAMILQKEGLKKVVDQIK